ncbi:MAG: glycosyltransferase family 39 protein [bacterium]|nr:glycosyltransferase family 39 protein [bacterium]
MEGLKNKVKHFLSQRENQIFLGIFIFALALRLYFFFQTYNQALWWDEADYMSIAKHYGLGTPEVAAPWRARGMSLIFGIFYFFGANEIFQRLVVIAFSVAAVWITYILGKEFFDKKVALIASCFMSVLWIHLFWSMRFSGEIFALVFYCLAAYFFWKGYVKNGSKWYMIFSGLLIGYGIFLYESVGAIFIFLAVFLFVTERFKFFKNKQFWWGMLGLAISLGFIFGHYYDLYGQVYPRVSHIIEGSLAEGTELDAKLAEQGFFSVFFTTFVFFQNMLDYFHWVILIVFLIGLIYYINLILGFDLVWKNKDEKLKKDFYVLWWAFSVMLFFGAYLAVVKTYYEPRYIFPAYPILFLIAAQGVIYIADFLEKQKKHLGTAAIIIIILLAAYSHIGWAAPLIENKAYSFSQERAAGEWLKENTKPGDILLACSQVVPFVYYSEREAITFRYNTTEVDYQIKNWSVPYLILDGYIQDCNVNYVAEREANLTPVQVYYEGEYPIVIIYETKGYF